MRLWLLHISLFFLQLVICSNRNKETTSKMRDKIIKLKDEIETRFQHTANHWRSYSQLQAAKMFLSAVPLTCRLAMALRSQLRYSSVLTALTSSSVTRLSRTSTCVSRSNMLKFAVSSTDRTSWFIRRSSFFTCRISTNVSTFSCWICSVNAFNLSQLLAICYSS